MTAVPSVNVSTLPVPPLTTGTALPLMLLPTVPKLTAALPGTNCKSPLTGSVSVTTMPFVVPSFSVRVTVYVSTSPMLGVELSTPFATASTPPVVICAVSCRR